MPPRFQLFVVFHNVFYEKCYDDIPQEWLDTYFTFVAVNPKLPKIYNPSRFTKVINEWELPVYDGDMQKQGYNENSAIQHVYVNNLYKPYEKIGFYQYDMCISKQHIIQIMNNINDLSWACALESLHPNRVWSCFDRPDVPQVVYNEFISYFAQNISSISCPMYNTYLIPCTLYTIIMPWVLLMKGKLYPWSNQSPHPTHWGHIGGIFERLMGIAISQTHPRNINNMVGVQHNQNELKVLVDKDHPNGHHQA